MSELNVDGDGFLMDRDDWSEQLMHQLAVQDSVDLTEDHVKYILSAREMYAEDGVVPPLREFAKHHGMDRKGTALNKLFSGGPMKKIAKWGGLPKPTGCV